MRDAYNVLECLRKYVYFPFIVLLIFFLGCMSVNSIRHFEWEQTHAPGAVVAAAVGTCEEGPSGWSNQSAGSSRMHVPAHPEQLSRPHLLHCIGHGGQTLHNGITDSRMRCHCTCRSRRRRCRPRLAAPHLVKRCGGNGALSLTVCAGSA
jgi:hypothetical protein